MLENVFQPMIALPDSPRNRYLNAVKYLVFGIELERVGKLAFGRAAQANPTAT
jgi:hypothetical protein